MGLAQKLTDLQTAQRHSLVRIQNLNSSASAEMHKAQERARAELVRDRRQHIENMSNMGHSWSRERGIEIAREYIATDLKGVGFTSHVASSQRAVITYLAEPSRGETLGHKLIAILDANRDADLRTYEEDLEVFILRIDKPEPKEPEGGIIIGAM